MANVKISELPAAAAALTSQEFEVNESGTTKKVTGSQVKSFVKSGLTSTDIDGVTSPIQTQLDGKQPLAPNLTNLAAMSGGGIMVRNNAGNYFNRTIQAGTGIVVTNGSGISAAPSIAANIASQAEAEAGTDATKLMTPQRVAQAIDVQAESMVLLGTLTTISNPTQTLPSLVLTSYKRLLIEVSGVSHDSGSNRSLVVGTANCCRGVSSGSLLYGKSEISLFDGVAVSSVDVSSSTGRDVYVQLSGITSASTSIIFSWDGSGDFDAGTIRVYGVR